MPPNTYNTYQNQYPVQNQQQAYANEPTVDTLPAYVFESPQNVPTYQQSYLPLTPQGNSQNATSQTATVNQAVTEDSESSAILYVNYALYLLGIVVLFFVIKKLISLWRSKFNLTSPPLPPVPPLPSEYDTIPCSTCGGLGKIKKKEKKFVPCTHCKETGTDICHYCGGTGEYSGGYMIPETKEEAESFMKCDYCSGTGFTNPPLFCCMCKGKKQEEYEETIDVICADCKGAGRR